MRPTHRATAVAAAAAAGGVGLMALGQPGAGVALFTAGLGTGLLVTEESAPAHRPDEAARGAVQAQALLTQGLNLEGPAIMVPPGPTLDAPRCFIPARHAGPDEVPPLDGKTVIHRGPPGVLGVALPPAGLGLLAAWEREQDLPHGQGLEAGLLHLKRAFQQLGLGEGVRMRRSANLVRVSYTHRLMGALCAWTRDEGAPSHVQGMCPACSFVHAVVAVAAAAPVVAREAEGRGDRVTLTLEVGPSSQA